MGGADLPRRSLLLALAGVALLALSFAFTNAVGWIALGAGLVLLFAGAIIQATGRR